MEEQVQQRPQALRLLTPPGVGPVTAFRNGKAVAIYIGIIPSTAPCRDGTLWLVNSGSHADLDNGEVLKVRGRTRVVLLEETGVILPHKAICMTSAERTRTSLSREIEVEYGTFQTSVPSSWLLSGRSALGMRLI